MMTGAYDVGTWDERRRLAQIVADARALLIPAPLAPAPADVQLRQLARRTGQLEAMLAMLADSAEIVAGESRG